jgi:hypothetical protein
MTEAPRGILIHSYRYDARARWITVGRRHHAHRAQRGQCRESPALLGRAGRHKETAELRRRLEMIVRAYDPCISCSVHLVRRRMFNDSPFRSLSLKARLILSYLVILGIGGLATSMVGSWIVSSTIQMQVMRAVDNNLATAR